MRKRTLGAIAVVCALLLSPLCFAVESNWIGPATGVWSLPANWDNGVPNMSGPLDFRDAVIDNAAVTIDGDFDVTSTTVGRSTSATLLASEFRLDSRGYTLGEQQNASGTLHITGTANVASGNRETFVGREGTGLITQAGLSLTEFEEVFIAFAATAQGRYELHDGMFISDEIRVGVSGQGTFVQTGGTIRLNNAGSRIMTLGYQAGGHGRYEFTGGTLNNNEDNTYVGFFGTGEFIHTGGVFQSTKRTITLGAEPDAVGTYRLGGTGVIAQLSKLRIGTFGTGTFIQEGGALDTDDIDMPGQSTFELVGSLGTATTQRLTMASTANLTVQANATGIGTIQVIQAAQLDGELIVIDNGAPAGSWDVVTSAGTYTESFDNIQLPANGLWSVQSGPNTLTLTKVPEPASATLLGACALIFARRRRA